MNSVIVLQAPSMRPSSNYIGVSSSFFFDFVVALRNLIAALPRLRAHPEILSHIQYTICICMCRYISIQKKNLKYIFCSLAQVCAFQFYDALVKTHDAPLMRNATGDETEVEPSGVALGWVEFCSVRFSSVEVLMCRKGAQTIEGQHGNIAHNSRQDLDAAAASCATPALLLSRGACCKMRIFYYLGADRRIEICILACCPCVIKVCGTSRRKF